MERTAKTEEEFSQSWDWHIDQLLRLAHSLPVKSIPKLNQTVDTLRLLKTEAVVHTYPAKAQV